MRVGGQVPGEKVMEKRVASVDPLVVFRERLFELI